MTQFKTRNFTFFAPRTVIFDEKVRWNPLKCSLTLAGVTPGEKPNGAGYRYALPLRLTMHLLRQLSLRLL